MAEDGREAVEGDLTGDDSGRGAGGAAGGCEPACAVAGGAGLGRGGGDRGRAGGICFAGGSRRLGYGGAWGGAAAGGVVGRQLGATAPDLIQIRGQGIHPAPRFAGIPCVGRVFHRPAELGDHRKPEHAPGAAHAVTQERDSDEIQPVQIVAHRRGILPAVAQKHLRAFRRPKIRVLFAHKRDRRVFLNRLQQNRLLDRLGQIRRASRRHAFFPVAF